ncbi:MAG: acyltransferase [Opitutae bacterium]|nr:acyltransferase [Opitutae bacterium]
MQLTLTVPGGPRAGRIAAFDELKGLAILLVVLYHAGGVLVWQNFLHGDLGVDIFVILSGAGLALGSHGDEPAGKFLARRLRRIAPAYWIVLAAYAVANAVVLEQPASPINLALHALGVHAWFGDGLGLSVNDSFWFITLIVSLYLLYLWFRRLRSSESLLLAGALVAVAVSFAFFFSGQSAMFAHLGLRLPGFVLGILLGRLLRDGRLTLDANATLGAAFFILVYVPYTQGIVFHTAVAGLALIAAYTLWLRPALPASAAAPVQRTLAFLGAHSLEIFLIHQPLLRDYNTILQIRWFHVSQPTPPTLALGMVVALVVTLLLSVELKRLLDRLFAPRAQ